MITLHKLGHADESFQLNPDLIVSVESRPDTVITLATSAKVVVSDTPEQVSMAVRSWRADVLATALKGPARPRLAAVDSRVEMRVDSRVDSRVPTGGARQMTAGIEGSLAAVDVRGR
ncbi:MAG TPA: flagellar FlbD family protein [Solirubrobacteraceae bacterium]|jgi:flagellar protein FlbD